MTFSVCRIIIVLCLIIISLVLFLNVDETQSKIITAVIGFVVSYLPLCSFNKKSSVKNININMLDSPIRKETENNQIAYYKEDKLLWDQFLKTFPKDEFNILTSLTFSDYSYPEHFSPVAHYAEMNLMFIDNENKFINLELQNAYIFLLNSILEYTIFLAGNTFPSKRGKYNEFAKEWRHEDPSRFIECEKKLHDLSQKSRDAYNAFYNLAKNIFATPIFQNQK